jgi:hypothetical protein
MRLRQRRSLGVRGSQRDYNYEGIDIEVVDIPDGLRADIKAAQARQYPLTL